MTWQQKRRPKIMCETLIEYLPVIPRQTRRPLSSSYTLTF